ncbi:MAG: ATP-binding domain-containing protein, partial [Candidatus Paceibacterota bacterium]
QLHLWTYGELAAWTEHLKSAVFAGRGIKAKLKDLSEEQPNEIVCETSLFNEAHVPAINRGDIDWFMGHVLESKLSAYEYGATIAKSNPSMLETDPSIIVGTIHSVKGGEAATVAVLPDLSIQGHMQWNRRGSERDSVRRLFYVGITRAKNKLILCEPSCKTAISWRE